MNPTARDILFDFDNVNALISRDDILEYAKHIFVYLFKNSYLIDLDSKVPEKEIVANNFRKFVFLNKEILMTFFWEQTGMYLLVKSDKKIPLFTNFYYKSFGKELSEYAEQLEIEGKLQKTISVRKCDYQKEFEEMIFDQQ